MGKTFCKVEKKWCKLLKRGVCTFCDNNIEKVNRCPRLAKIETVRLIELLKRTNFEDTFKALCTWHSDQEKNKNGYQHVFNTLLQMKPKKHNLSDLIIVVEKTKDNICNIEYLDTHGIDPITKKRFGIEFVDWNDWISMFIYEQTLNDLTPEEIIGACLYEMTFYGFEEAKVKQQLQKMVGDIEEMKK